MKRGFWQTVGAFVLLVAVGLVIAGLQPHFGAWGKGPGTEHAAEPAPPTPSPEDEVKEPIVPVAAADTPPPTPTTARQAAEEQPLRILHVVAFPADAATDDIFADAGVDLTRAEILPADLSPYDGIVLESYAAAKPAQLARLQQYVASGGGVLLSGGTPYFLCGQTMSVGCLGWFGDSASYCNVGAGATASIVDTNAFSSRVEPGARIVGPTLGYGGACLSGWSQETRLMARWDNLNTAAILVATPGAGRAGFVTGFYDEGSEWEDENAHAIMVDIVRWLAGAS